MKLLITFPHIFAQKQFLDNLDSLLYPIYARHHVNFTSYSATYGTVQCPMHSMNPINIDKLRILIPEIRVTKVTNSIANSDIPNYRTLL